MMYKIYLNYIIVSFLRHNLRSTPKKLSLTLYTVSPSSASTILIFPYSKTQSEGKLNRVKFPFKKIFWMRTKCIWKHSWFSFTTKFNLTVHFYSPSVIWSFLCSSSSSSSRSKVEDPGRGNMPINKGMQRDITILLINSL